MYPAPRHTHTKKPGLGRVKRAMNQSEFETNSCNYAKRGKTRDQVVILRSFPFVRTGQPDRSVRKWSVSI